MEYYNHYQPHTHYVVYYSSCHYFLFIVKICYNKIACESGCKDIAVRRYRICMIPSYTNSVRQSVGSSTSKKRHPEHQPIAEDNDKHQSD